MMKKRFSYDLEGNCGPCKLQIRLCVLCSLILVNTVHKSFLCRLQKGRSLGMCSRVYNVVGEIYITWSHGNSAKYIQARRIPSWSWIIRQPLLKNSFLSHCLSLFWQWFCKATSNLGNIVGSTGKESPGKHKHVLRNVNENSDNYHTKKQK